MTLATSPSGRSPILPSAFASARPSCARASPLAASMRQTNEIRFAIRVIILLTSVGAFRELVGREAEQLGVLPDQREQLLVDLEALLLGDVDVDVEAYRLVGCLQLHRTAPESQCRDSDSGGSAASFCDHGALSNSR